MVSTVDTLRKQHPTFTYQDFHWQIVDQTLECGYTFAFSPEIQFTPTLRIPLPEHFSLEESHLTFEMIEWWVGHIGLVEMLSYWKAAASPQIHIKALPLTKEQLSWWKDLLIHGMGEYFYVNKIDFTTKTFVKLSAEAPPKLAGARQLDTLQTQTMQDRPVVIDADATLIPLGGGKDSVVAIELLKRFQTENPDQKYQLVAVNPTAATQAVAAASQLPLITIERRIDPRLLKLNQDGYLNGHTPFSALLAFVTSFTALLYGVGQVAVANEQSANESSLEYAGHHINHQYSKSFAFESDFRMYAQRFGPQPTPSYFSVLRPLHELKIAQLFSQVGEAYFQAFVSCNRTSAKKRWCGECAKCLFTYLILSPYLTQRELEAIFGQNVLENGSLLPTLHALIGSTPDKPLDCVGLRQESLAACYLTTKKLLAANQPLPQLLQSIQSDLQTYSNLDQSAQQLVAAWHNEHFIPLKLARFMQQLEL